MRVAVFSTKLYDKRYFRAANEGFGHELVFFEPRLSALTISLSAGAKGICVFVHDDVSGPVLRALKERGVQYVALCCARFNNVDVTHANELGIRVARVPACSPHLVAEHTLAFILALNRKIRRAYTRVCEGNLALEGLLGFDLRGGCVGVVGTRKIGRLVAEILLGFVCCVAAHDRRRDSELEKKGVRYVDLAELFARADIITLHCPLTSETHHLINADAVYRMKRG